MPQAQWSGSAPSPLLSALEVPPPGSKHPAELIQNIVEFHLELLQDVTGLGIQLRREKGHQSF